MTTDTNLKEPEPGKNDINMPVKANGGGVSPIMLKKGYEVLDGGPERCRDEMLSSGSVLVETDDGGFLGRTQSSDSETSEL